MWIEIKLPGRAIDTPSLITDASSAEALPGPAA
jgi:hypothetical protein